MTHNLTIQSNDTAWIESLYQDKPSANEKITIDDKLLIEYIDDENIGKGFGGTEIAFNILITVVVGIPVNIIAALIYDKLMNKGENVIVDKKSKITLHTQADIIIYLEKCNIEEK